MTNFSLYPPPLRPSNILRLAEVSRERDEMKVWGKGGGGEFYVFHFVLNGCFQCD